MATQSTFTAEGVGDPCPRKHIGGDFGGLSCSGTDLTRVGERRGHSLDHHHAFVAGVIAKVVMPGSNEPSGFTLTTSLGIVGALVWDGTAPSSRRLKSLCPRQFLSQVDNLVERCSRVSSGD
jgi:hypothetical protein